MQGRDSRRIEVIMAYLPNVSVAFKIKFKVNDGWDSVIQAAHSLS